ncbi:MAG: glycosyltransferase family 4 protein [Flavobacteriales bacterium]|nr:glycosyltransferase family 4 protein [Flavobacteriales bacterium]
MQHMRIAVNTRLLLSEKLEGIGWFTHESFRRIVKAHPEHQFIFLFDRPFDKRFVYEKNVEAVTVHPPTRHPLLYRIWFEYMLPRALRKSKADVFISPDGFLSMRANIPQLAVMHDLNFEHYPEDLPPAYSRYYRRWFPCSPKKAARLVTVSNFSKGGYRDALPCAEGPHRRGVQRYRRCVHTAFGKGETRYRDRFTKGLPYLVCVGAMHRRKTLRTPLAAFDRLAADRPDVRLLIVGERMFKDARMERAWNAMKHQNHVVFAGRLGQADLRLALGGSEALVYVSYFEGFGIPVAEAMACGVPVIAANATSLPEVAGDAAIYCDPFNIEDITRCMRVMVDDDALRQRLITAGKARARSYTWDRTAQGVWESIEKMTAIV